jgi:hypothetical protein
MEQLNPDTLKVLRILIKISSAIENIDEVVESKYYKRCLKREIKFFMDEVVKTVDPIMIILMKKDDTTYPILLKAISDYSKNFLNGDDEKVNLMFLYSKLKSIENDYSELTETTKLESHLMLSIMPKLRMLYECIENTHSHIVNAKDKNGIKVNSIISMIDDLSKEIIK